MIVNRTSRDLIAAGFFSMSPQSQASLATVQSKRLCRLIDYCFRYSPYYRRELSRNGFDHLSNCTAADLVRLPILTKQIVMDQMADMLSSQVNPERCRRRHTSGTSGIDITLPEIPFETFVTNMQWSKLYMRSGMRPWHRQTKITTLSRFGYQKYFIQGLGLFRRDYINSTDSPAEKIAKLKKNKPDALVCWATMLEEITRQLEDTDSYLDIPLVFSTANMLWPGVRRRTSERLRANVFDVYGAVETGPIAWECAQHNGYHVQGDQVVVELLDDQDKPASRGRMVCTVLWRRTLPLIRYAVGDSAEWADTPCPCGSPYPLLKSLDGRVTDLVRLPDGTHINSVTLRHAIIGKPGVEQYQLVQESPTRFRLRIVRNDRYTDKVGDSIADEFRNQFGGMLEITIVVVARIRMPPEIKFTPMVTLERMVEMKSRGVDVGVIETDER